MTKWRIVGLAVLALLAAGYLLWPLLKPAPPPVAPAPPPAREVFHSSKPIRIEVSMPADASGAAADVTWLEYELRHLLSRGRMRVAAVTADADAFTLKVKVAAGRDHASIALIAPDRVVERQEQVQLPAENRLAAITALAQRLPQFLGTQSAGSASWAALIGTEDTKAYDAYLDDALSLLGPAGHGFTTPGGPQQAHMVERLESLARHQPHFTRARAALAIAYLSLGGQDQASLSQLAKTSAERAVSGDDEIAEAHAALALVHVRRGDWIAAREQFDRALALDANSAPALEGSGCVLLDAGQYQAARPLLDHAVKLQPGNVGALECLAYLDASGENPADAEKSSSTVARVQALAALLAGNFDSARRSLHDSLSDDDFRNWAEPLLQAAANRARIPDALQSITRSANDGRIDATTEILCGVALRRAEFVFNRMARLQREREPVPLRVLWMPQTTFLRRHSRFEQIVSAAGLPAFWQEYGTADACKSEPNTYGCKVRQTSDK
jgi:tetratricopeptide (TPR) repeat protein